jgi:hypothetical protein
MVANNFIFVHIPKTGGNSITKALKDYSIDRIKFIRRGNGILLANMGLEKHCSLSEYSKVIDTDVYFKFSVIRNPYDRFLSWFYYEKKYFDYGGDMKQFFFTMCDTSLFRSQYELLKPAENKNGIDFLLRYENLKSDFKILCTKLNVDVRLGHINNSKKPEYVSLEPDVKKLIREYFEMDFEYYYKNV